MLGGVALFAAPLAARAQATSSSATPNPSAPPNPSAAPSVSAAASASAAASPSAAPKKVDPVVPTLPVSIAVVVANGKAAQSQAWIDAQLAEAQRIYNGFGIYFRKAEVRRLPPQFDELKNRKDRDALATQLKKGVINVFIVSTLIDVDNPTQERMGVHWAPNGDLKKQYCIVAAGARKTTMAHEIGHFFTLQHTQVPDNLMSYIRTGADVVMNSQQKQKVIASAKTYVARKELVP